MPLTVPTGDPATLLLPEGTRLLHIGPPKTGTTALQAAFDSCRGGLRAQGVRYAGRTRHSASAVRAALGRATVMDGGRTPEAGPWNALVREIRRAEESRVVLSSEFLADATGEAVRRIVDDLDPARVHVAVTLRPLARILPSQWQQYVRGGITTSYDTWLEAVLTQSSPRVTPSFWHRHRHDRLVDRWADVAGPANISVIALDEGDHGMALRVFEQLLGLREGTLVAVADLANRSFTLPEAEAVRAFNIAFRAEGLDSALRTRVMHLGAARYMRRRTPLPGEARIETPQWALDRATEIAREMVANIAASGVRVVGDLERLAEPEQSGLPAGPHEGRISPEIAASMAMGILVTTGGARRATGVSPGPAARAAPRDIANVSTYLVAGVIGLRAREAAVRRIRQMRRRFPGG